MGRAFNIKQEDNPLWLLLVSRSDAGNPDPRKVSFEYLIDYINQFSSREIPPLNSPNFIDQIQWRQKDFFSILQQEARYYHAVFHNQYGDHDAYTQELIDQVEKTYGKGFIGKLQNHQITHDIAGNMVVALAMAAVADMALIEYLHGHGRLNDKEREFGLDEINRRMDRIGINGVDLLLESRPELERFIEKDTTIIHVPRSVGVLRDSYTRAAYYNTERGKINDSVESLTRLRQKTISFDFPKLEERKKHYILMHVNDIPSPHPETRKKYAKLGLSKTRVDFSRSDILREIVQDINKGDLKKSDEYINFLLHDGIAINHPERDTYAESLRKRMREKNKDIIDAEIISIRKIDPNGKEPPLLGGSHTVRLEQGKNPPHHREVPAKEDDIIDAEIINISQPAADAKPPETGKGALAIYKADKPNETKHASSNTGAQIATLGGALGVGLLLASGNKKDNENGKDKDDNKESNTALRFAAVAAAAAVAGGGAIMWSKKPEFLYKPMKSFFDSLGFGRA